MRRKAKRNPIKVTGAHVINPPRQAKRRRSRNPDSSSTSSGGSSGSISGGSISGGSTTSSYGPGGALPGTMPGGRSVGANPYMTNRRRKNAKKAAVARKVHSRWGKVSAHKRRVANPIPFRFRPIAGRRVFRGPVAKARFMARHPRFAAKFLRNRKKHKRNSVFVTNRKHSKRKNKHTRRRNTGMVAGAIGSAQGLARKVPLIGGLVASALGYIVPVALGAIGVEPTMQVAKYVGGLVPNMNASVFYLATSLITAALAKWLLPKTGFVSVQMADRVALAIASGGGAVAYYKMRTGDSKDMGSEVGALEVAMGDGFATAVAPLGTFAGMFSGDDDDMGALEVVSGMYGDSTAQDIADAPDDFSMGEIETILSGPRRFKKKYGKSKGGRRAHQEGHRQGWLIHLLGYEGVQELAKKSPEERKEYIRAIKAHALTQLQQIGATATQATETAGLEAGAMAYGY